MVQRREGDLVIYHVRMCFENPRWMELSGKSKTRLVVKTAKNESNYIYI